ncbi:hypothetical protein TVAG_362980 [Trichomonas vaginalis G3]|uniref:Uncharacterized protein n=1 Tax=Trichomonas vaginalis (strain ATCC PRA-98 / G3) TaxID=412133 RepID=A2G344_TRIV3|nr:hypothetical protein TVAGG3_0643590 [Trichomonas vaginalis G3]EAX88424.1 hypothetical protein TVAG_362980 [Trichomonas vaginalis G3]KAI5505348.1 hypothetical protein TVAGG3_0643590 [Trichomonas vaginalis G3]|eukprot:XP_001301354.1 hypothetical protein [Trichomonas vaginalis G3]
MGFGDYVKAGWGKVKEKGSWIVENPGLAAGALAHGLNYIDPRFGQVGGLVGSLGERLAKATLGEDSAITKNLKAFNKALGFIFVLFWLISYEHGPKMESGWRGNGISTYWEKRPRDTRDQ